MTEHSHVRDVEVHVVDAETCVHRFLPLAVRAPWLDPPTTETPTMINLHAAQCHRQPAYIAGGMPVCPQHLPWVIAAEHGRGNPDVVVRPWP